MGENLYYGLWGVAHGDARSLRGREGPHGPPGGRFRVSVMEHNKVTVREDRPPWKGRAIALFVLIGIGALVLFLNRPDLPNIGAHGMRAYPTEAMEDRGTLSVLPAPWESGVRVTGYIFRSTSGGLPTWRHHAEFEMRIYGGSGRVLLKERFVIRLLDKPWPPGEGRDFSVRLDVESHRVTGYELYFVGGR